MAAGSRDRRPFLTPPGGDRGPFSLPSLSDAYGWGGYEQERDIYLRAVPNATDDQLETGVGVWYRLSETLGARSLEDQARIVLAFPFVSQDLVLAGGVGPETRRVTERYPAVTLEELRDTIGAAAGEIRRGTAGVHSRRASAAEAREAIRDMKGATLAALERIPDEDSEAAAAYLEALRASAREIRTAKATKAELAAVARLIGAPLPSDVDSWSQVKKARLKDLLEEHLEAEVNPPRVPWPVGSWNYSREIMAEARRSAATVPRDECGSRHEVTKDHGILRSAAWFTRKNSLRFLREYPEGKERAGQLLLDGAAFVAAKQLPALCRTGSTLAPDKIDRTLEELAEEVARGDYSSHTFPDHWTLLAERIFYALKVSEMRLEATKGKEEWGHETGAGGQFRLFNPARPWTAEFRRPWSPRDPDYFPYEHRTSYKYGARPGYPQMSGLWSDVVAFDLEAPPTRKEKEALEEVLQFFRKQEEMGWKQRSFKPNTGHGAGFHYRVFRSLVGKGFLDHAPKGYDEGRPDWNYTNMEYDSGGLIPGQRKLPQEAGQLRLFNPSAALDVLDHERLG